MFITNPTNVDAVNRVLGSIGDSPVNSLDNPTNVNVINAIKNLEQVNRQEQAKGWSFNIIESYTLNPSTESNMISWSSTFLRLKGSNGTLAKKGDYVYNFTNQTFIFTSAIQVEAIILVDLEEMPEPMRNYIIAKTSQQYQQKYLGDPTLAQGIAQELKEAWQALQEYEIEMNDLNILENSDMLRIVRS